MTRTYPEMDVNGDYLFSGQVYSSARDFARLGLLYLSDGVWDGERLLPEGWTEYASSPLSAQPADSWANPDCQEACDRAYGAQFWIYGPPHGSLDGSYAPSGARGQLAVIVPHRNVVIVRRGFDRAREPSFDMSKFGQDVLNAID